MRRHVSHECIAKSKRSWRALRYDGPYIIDSAKVAPRRLHTKAGNVITRIVLVGALFERLLCAGVFVRVVTRRCQVLRFDYISSDTSATSLRMSNAPAGLHEAFDNAIKAQENHVKIARALINQAVALLRRAEQPESKFSAEDVVKVTAALEKGSKMETRANAELIKLMKEKPR